MAPVRSAPDSNPLPWRWREACLQMCPSTCSSISRRRAAGLHSGLTCHVHPSGLTHLYGLTKFQPAQSIIAMVAPIGPLTWDHGCELPWYSILKLSHALATSGVLHNAWRWNHALTWSITTLKAGSFSGPSLNQMLVVAHWPLVPLEHALDAVVLSLPNMAGETPHASFPYDA